MKRLSDAIDEGSLLKPQRFDGGGVGMDTCALQAACEALGRPWDTWETLSKDYPWIDEINAQCPASDEEYPCTGDSVFEQIYHLNDDHHWPRPKIAAWLRTIEPVEDAQVLEPAEAAVRG